MSGDADVATRISDSHREWGGNCVSPTLHTTDATGLKVDGTDPKVPRKKETLEKEGRFS